MQRVVHLLFCAGIVVAGCKSRSENPTAELVDVSGPVKTPKLLRENVVGGLTIDTVRKLKELGLAEGMCMKISEYMDANGDHFYEFSYYFDGEQWCKKLRVADKPALQFVARKIMNKERTKYLSVIRSPDTFEYYVYSKSDPNKRNVGYAAIKTNNLIESVIGELCVDDFKDRCTLHINEKGRMINVTFPD